MSNTLFKVCDFLDNAASKCVGGKDPWIKPSNILLDNEQQDDYILFLFKKDVEQEIKEKQKAKSANTL